MISQEIKDKFKKENWMEIDEAIAHIKNWIETNNLPSAENWIKEVEKFVEFDPEINKLKEELLSKKSKTLDKKYDKVEEKANKVVKKEVSKYPKWERILAGLSYFWFLAILPLVLKRESELCQHHWKQWVIFAIFFFLMLTMWKFFPFVWAWMVVIASLLQFIIAIFWWIQGFSWKMWNAPFVWKMAEKMEF